VLQRPALPGVFDEPCVTPSWSRLPSRFVVAGRDGFVDAAAQRHMAARAGSSVLELGATHAVPRTHPEAVATEILRAARRT
jgi:pimeloyl-ACP methyl ester carboxylesterase